MDGREERKVNFRGGKRMRIRAYVRARGEGGLLCLIQDSRVVSRYGIDRQTERPNDFVYGNSINLFDDCC